MAKQSVTIRQFDEESMRKLARTADEVALLRREIRSLRSRAGFSYPNTARVGIAYGSLTALSGTTPGSGDVKFYELEETDPSLGNLDELPTTVYNIGSQSIAEGAKIICWLDLSGKYNDDASPVWVTRGESGSTSGYAQLITSDPIRSDAASTVFDEWEQGESSGGATLFEFVDDDDTADNRKTGIKVLQDGMYLVGWNATIEITTSSGGTLVVSGSPGQNLCTDIIIEQVGLTASLNDDAVTAKVDPIRDIVGDGTHPGHAEVILSAWRICGTSIHGHGNHCSPATLQADDTIRLWCRPVTTTMGRLVLTVDLWVQYIGPVDYTNTGTA